MRRFSCPKALEAAASALEAEAHALRREAEMTRQRAAERERMAEIRTIWKRVTAMMDRGIPEETARAIEANRLGCSLETIDYWMVRSGRRSATYQKWRRDREIFQRAHTLSNRDLAEIYGLTPTQISRIIRAQLASRHRR